MSLWTRIANVFRAEQTNCEIDEELEAHIAEAIARGRQPEEVRRAFGSALRHPSRSEPAGLVVVSDIGAIKSFAPAAQDKQAAVLQSYSMGESGGPPTCMCARS